MNSKELYVAFCQVLSSNTNNPIRPTFEDFSRPAKISIGLNHKDSTVSYAVLEFAGDTRAKFFCQMLFDGAGPNDTTVHNFTMPRQKLTMEQKGLMSLAMIDFLEEVGAVNFDFEIMREKINFGVNGGLGDLLFLYDQLSSHATRYVKENESNKA